MNNFIKIFKKVLKVIFYLFLLIPYILLLIFSKILGIKFKYLNFLRIGHMIPDGFKSYYLKKISNKPFQKKIIYVVDFRTCNYSLRDYFTKLIPITKFISIFKTINFYMPKNLKLIEAAFTNTTARDPNNLYRKFNPISFPSKHIELTKIELKKRGWSQEPIVSLIVRDNAYLDNRQLSHDFGKDWSYHNYRNYHSLLVHMDILLVDLYILMMIKYHLILMQP